VIVKNNTVSIIGMQMPGKSGFTTLLPGVNTIAKSDWEEFIKNPARRHQLAEGELEVLEEDELPSLKGKSEKDAIALVRATVRKDLLEGWIDTESRKKVLDAIDKQLEAITPKAPPKDEGAAADPEADADAGADDAEP
jgi:hypothetical protein